MSERKAAPFASKSVTAAPDHTFRRGGDVQGTAQLSAVPPGHVPVCSYTSSVQLRRIRSWKCHSPSFFGAKTLIVVSSKYTETRGRAQAWRDKYVLGTYVLFPNGQRLKEFREFSSPLRSTHQSQHIHSLINFPELDLKGSVETLVKGVRRRHKYRECRSTLRIRMTLASFICVFGL